MGYIFAPYQVEVDANHIALISVPLNFYILSSPCQLPLGADYFYPHAEFIRLRSPLVGSGKAVTKGSSITVGRINPGA
ncbi:hypothetical protein DW169_03965 [Bacteroides intestinalis]|nr:hypothetical protein DW169_03965 [Bacteroides intestinalis]